MGELIINDEDLVAEEHWPVECVLGFYGERVTSHLSVFRLLRMSLLAHIMVASLLVFSTACCRSVLTYI